MLQSHGGPDLVLRRGGAVPLAPDTKRWFCVASRGGHDPPACDTKIGFRHPRHARSSRLGGSASFGETKRLEGVWTQDRGLGNQLLKK